MPKSLPLPDDLIDLQRATLATETAVSEYVTAVETRRRDEFPAPEQVVERRMWTAGETAELDQLQAAYVVAALAVRAHPIWLAARDEDAYGATWLALKDAAKVPVTA